MKMRKSKYLAIAFLSLTTVFLSHCVKKEYTLDPPPSKVEGLNGSWKLNSVIQVDEVSLSKGERDLSPFYIGEESMQVMEVAFKSSDKTFVITPGEIGRNYLPSSGIWAFDDDNYPQYIYLKDDAGEISTLKLQGPTRPADTELKFSFQRFCSINGLEQEYVGYRYEFNRQ